MGEELGDLDLHRARRGDPAAFARMLDRHRGVVDAACGSVCFDAAERDEAFQLASIEIWQGLGSFRGESALTTWIYTVARHAAIRSRRRVGPPSEPVAQVPDLRATSAPDGAVVTQDAVLTAISSLPPDQREALMLSTHSGLSSHEIADLLGVADGTVRSWISRARDHIRSELRSAER